MLLEEERVCLEQLVHRYFGYYMLQIGSIGGELPSLVPGRLHSRIMVAPERPALSSSCWIQGAPDRLPVASDSVDVVLLLHTLDFYPDPHQTLREVERVLIPEGRLIVVGFNPWSLWVCGACLAVAREARHGMGGFYLSVAYTIGCPCWDSGSRRPSRCCFGRRCGSGC